MTVRDVGGCLIDLTRRDRQSDQLSAFYPGAQSSRPEIRRDRGRSPEGLRGRRAGPGVRSGASRHPAAGRGAQGERARRRGLLHPRGRLALPAGDDHVLESGQHADRRRSARLDSRRSLVRVEPRGSGRPVLGLRPAFRPGVWRGRRRAPDPGRAMPGSCCFAISDHNGKVAVRLAPGETYRLSRGSSRARTSSTSVASPISSPARKIILSTSR